MTLLESLYNDYDKVESAYIELLVLAEEIAYRLDDLDDSSFYSNKLKLMKDTHGIV